MLWAYFSIMWAFDMQSDWEYIEHVKDIFKQKNNDTEFFFVEFVTSQKIRLERNATENRMKHKASKRDIDISNQRLLNDDVIIATKVMMVKYLLKIYVETLHNKGLQIHINTRCVELCS